MIDFRDRLSRSVRSKLLAMVLAPLFLGVPILLGLVWMWGTQGYQQLVSYKVSSDLVTAHEYFAHMHQTVAVDIGALAGSQRLSRAMAAPAGAALDSYLDEARRQAGLDFLYLLDARGELRRRPAPPPPQRPARRLAGGAQSPGR